MNMGNSLGAQSYGDRTAQLLSRLYAGTFDTVTALKALGAKNRVDGMLARTIDGRVWRFKLSSSLTGDDQLVATPAAGSGRWLLEPGVYRLQLAIGFATADAAVLLTLPAGCVLEPLEFYWTITADWTGGSSSAIGVSSAKTGYSTKGDLLGGATGNVLADLTVALSPQKGTIGAGFDTLAKRRTLFVATDNIRFDRITSAFTAGAGAVNALVRVHQNAGA
jgi:hypothetical protein